MKSNYVEELYLFAERNQVNEIAVELEKRWSALCQNVSNLHLIINNHADDVFGVEKNWRNNFNQDLRPENYVLALVTMKFTVDSKDAINTDTLGDSMYETIRKVIRNYPQVEYFSMFASEEDSNLPLK